MFRRAWWTRPRIAVGMAIVALLVVAVVWECGTDEVREGQPLDEAKAALGRAGGVDRSDRCGMFSSVGQHYQVSNSYWEFPDGRTIYLRSSRESDEEPFRLDSFSMWNGWYKLGGVELPVADSVRLRRSVFAVVLGWLR